MFDATKDRTRQLMKSKEMMVQISKTKQFSFDEKTAIIDSIISLDVRIQDNIQFLMTNGETL